MATTNLFKKTSATILTVMLMVTIVTAQARYKHVPRVKVDWQYSETNAIKEKVSSTTTTSAVIIAEENNATAYVAATENTTVASANEDVVVVNNKTKTAKHNKVVKNQKKPDRNTFTNKVKQNSKLLEVKDVKKTSMEAWVLVMILLFAVGIILLAIGLILLLVPPYFYTTGVLILLIIGGVLIAVGSLMLTLGQMGLF